MDQDFGFAFNSQETVVVESDMYNVGRSTKRFTAWFQIDGKNIAMITYLTYEDGVTPPTLCDIEVRKEFRGNKFALKFIEVLEAHVLGEKLHTTGSYTPEGFRSLSAAIPLVQSAYGQSEASVRFKSMDFVYDWDAFQLQH